MKNLTLKISLAALACSGFAMNAQAQSQTCADTVFVPAVYERWPHANDACLEILTRADGNLYARFEAEVLAQTPGGTYVRWTLNDGSKSKRVKITTPEDMEAIIGGNPVAIHSLNERQKVNVYLPQRSWVTEDTSADDAAAAAAASAAAAAAAMAAEEEAVEEEAVEEEEVAAPVMPTTAANLGWLAIFGALFLMLGGALRFARQR
jgi:hypothetical protein